jgi:hypothetical protein
VVILGLILTHQSRRSNLPATTTLSPLFSQSPSSNSNGIISFADPHRLSPFVSYRFKKHRGVGAASRATLDSSSPFRHICCRDNVFFLSLLPLCALGDLRVRVALANPQSNPFRINTCKSVSKQRTLTTFGMNTYEKPGGWGQLWLTTSSTLSSRSCAT